MKSLTKEHKKKLEGYVATLWQRHRNIVDEFVDDCDVVDGALDLPYSARIHVVRHMKREFCKRLLTRRKE